MRIIAYRLLGDDLLLLNGRSGGTGGLFHGEGVGVPGGGVLLVGLEPGEVEHGV